MVSGGITTLTGWMEKLHYAMGDEEGVPSLNDPALLLGFGASPPGEVLTASAQLHEPGPPA
jgi:hypothetical protein